MKPTTKRKQLKLSRVTVRELSTRDLVDPRGGIACASGNCCTHNCPYTGACQQTNHCEN